MGKAAQTLPSAACSGAEVHGTGVWVERMEPVEMYSPEVLQPEPEYLKQGSQLGKSQPSPTLSSHLFVHVGASLTLKATSVDRMRVSIFIR